jgi:hypothetical protein
MADTSKVSLVLTFKNASNSLYNMSFNYPDLAITGEQVDTLMDLIIAKDIVLTAGGALASISNGGLRTNSFTDLVE